jgi:hypothetical protein
LLAQFMKYKKWEHGKTFFRKSKKKSACKHFN